MVDLLVAQGVLSVMQGGSFEQAFWSGALGSLGASGFGAIGGKFAQSTVGTIAFGAISGGIGAVLSDGNFWEGAVIGGIVAGLNHVAHRVDNDDNGYDRNGNKINNKGGDTTDYLYNEDGQIISSTSVQEYYSQVPSGNSMRGYGYKWKPISPALKDPSFDMFVGYAGGGVVSKGLGLIARHGLAKFYPKLLKYHSRLTVPSTRGYGHGQFDVAHRSSAFFQKEIFLKGSFGIKNYRTVYFNHTVGNRTFSTGINPWNRTIFHQGPGKFK